MEIKVRPVREADHPAWFRMRRALWPDCPDDEQRLEIQHLSAPAPDRVIFIAAADDEAVGFAELFVRRDFVEGASETPVAYLEGWYVDENYRGRAIGRRLLEECEAWARERGFRELASDADLENEVSLCVHRACGFTEVSRTVHFIKPLRPASQT